MARLRRCQLCLVCAEHALDVNVVKVRYVNGWLGDYVMGIAYAQVRELDGWLRRRVRICDWFRGLPTRPGAKRTGTTMATAAHTFSKSAQTRNQLKGNQAGQSLPKRLLALQQSAQRVYRHG